jgi:gas vesicle protein
MERIVMKEIPQDQMQGTIITDRLCSFLVGLGIGVGVGCLLAPRAGKETVSLLNRKAEEGKDYLKHQADELRRCGADSLVKGREVINRQRDSLSEAIEAGKQAYRERVDPTAGQSI